MALMARFAEPTFVAQSTRIAVAATKVGLAMDIARTGFDNITNANVPTNNESNIMKTDGVNLAQAKNLEKTRGQNGKLYSPTV